MIIDILVPISPERFLPQRVFDSWLIQNHKFRFFMTNVIGDSAAQARESVRQMWLANEPSAPYVLASDNDIILNHGTLDVMIQFLEENEDFGAIGLQRGQAPNLTIEPNHVSAGPVLFRPEILRQIEYHNNDGCECLGMSNDVRNLGKRIGFLANVSYQHIETTNR